MKVISAAGLPLIFGGGGGRLQEGLQGHCHVLCLKLSLSRAGLFAVNINIPFKYVLKMKIPDNSEDLRFSAKLS